MTHINVSMSNAQGDIQHGVGRNDAEAFFRVTVNSTELFASEWERLGWSLTLGREE
jgi:hypothetical protein